MLFGGLAGLIGMVGLYGVMAYSVERRRHEIGIRMALGAAGGDMVRAVMREAGALLAAGLVIGLLSAAAAGRAVSTLLFGLTPRDPLTYAAAAACLAATAVIASYVPARRATRIEPVMGLGEECPCRSGDFSAARTGTRSARASSRRTWRSKPTTTSREA